MYILRVYHECFAGKGAWRNNVKFAQLLQYVLSEWPLELGTGLGKDIRNIPGSFEENQV